MPELTKAQKDENYQNLLQVLIENKRLGIITQDDYDARHRDLVREVYGSEEEQAAARKES